ncbi:MAG: bifunctional 4-hydroxy-3-methylbut-2-enyl diphosphate reductase/30S ribosomal protein S1 [Clostridia bacterium]|nr:bifunctional 4-hydroxy-3-methylbut-2-enyl diphosphate reductase/30S ribosomal protein S1 [Clostridia bacterium]
MITVAKNAGFCFGVKRATDTIEELIRKKGKGDVICTLGKLIHNAQYNKFLEDNGVTVIEPDDIDRLCQMAIEGTRVFVVVRAHGIEYDIQEKLENCTAKSENFRYIDCTCPYVKKIHKIADENSKEGEIFFLIGQKEHPEVKSIMSYVHNKGETFDTASELEEYIKCHDLSNFAVNMAAQTTQKLTEWEKSEKIIKKYCTNAKIFDTICSVTEKRQTEAKELARTCDLMLVIGGRDSSNTSKLVRVCKSYCPNTYWIETKGDLLLGEISNAKNIGITAGASTPDSIIQEVKETMENLNENFAQMLEEEYAKKAKIYVGATVTGTVMAISENEISLDLGDKLTGVITRDQLTDSNDVKLSELFKIGDSVEASVMSKSDVEGIAILSKKKVDVVKNWQKVVDLAASGEIVTAKVTKVTKGGVIATIDGVEVFIPASMTGIAKDGDMSVLAGTEQEVKVVEIKEDRKKAIASIKAVLREKKAAEKEAFWASLEEGMVFEGPVKSLTSYGAFVDLGGVDGLVHITELSWKRLKHPNEVVKVGDVIKVFVKSFDKEANRISLGHKTDDQNPWNIFKSQYAEGSVASVKVVGVTSFGAFAEIVPGVDGLIHISQIADRKIDSVANVLKVGDVVDAQVTGIDDEKQKVSLSIRALLTEEDAAEEVTEEAAEEVAEEAVEEVAEEAAPADAE